MKLKSLSLSVMVIGSTLLSTSVFASGYHFGTQSVSSQSTANASSAEASDASTIFYNAAGMTKLQGINFAGALNLVMPSVEYSNAQASYPSGTPTAVAGVTSGKITKNLIAVPHMYATYQLNDKITAGLGVYVPFASSTEYQRNSVLRYNLNATELKTLDINPTVAFKLNDQHSVAVGIIAQHAEAKLRQYANFGAAVAALSGGAAGGNGAYDGTADVKGEDWGFGFNLAWMWDISDKTTVGLNYRSAIKHTLEGEAKWTRSSDALAGPLAPIGAGIKAQYPDKESAKLDIKTPDSLSLHGLHKLNDKLTAFADVTYTKHSKFNRASLIYGTTKGTSGNTTILTPEWKDTWKVALGASYQLTDPMQLRFGVAYDKTPVPDDDHRLATMPDNDRTWFSVGANYKLNDKSSVDLAYSYIAIKDSKANVNGYCGGANAAAVACVSSKTKGSAEFKSHAQILGVQYNHRF